MCPNFNKSAVAFTKANKMHRVYKHHHNPPLRSLSTRLSCGLLSPSQLQTESSWLTRGKSAVMRRTLAPCRPMMNLCSQDGASTTRDSMLFAYITRIWQFNNKVIRLCPRLNDAPGGSAEYMPHVESVLPPRESLSVYAFLHCLFLAIIQTYIFDCAQLYSLPAKRLKWLNKQKLLLLLHPFNGLFSRATRVSQYQKGKINKQKLLLLLHPLTTSFPGQPGLASTRKVKSVRI